MKLTKRSSDANIEIIANGFIITISGRDTQDKYIQQKMFVRNLEEVNDTLQSYFELKED